MGIGIKGWELGFRFGIVYWGLGLGIEIVAMGLEIDDLPLGLGIGFVYGDWGLRL